MIVNTGLNAIRDAVKAMTENMKAGQSNDPTNLTMTDLVSTVYNANGDILNQNGTNYGESIHKMRINSAEANGFTLREVGLFLEDTNMLCRITHPDIEKDDQIELLYEVTLEVLNV